MLPQQTPATGSWGVPYRPPQIKPPLIGFAPQLKAPKPATHTPRAPGSGGPATSDTRGNYSGGKSRVQQPQQQLPQPPQQPTVVAPLPQQSSLGTIRMHGSGLLVSGGSSSSSSQVGVHAAVTTRTTTGPPRGTRTNPGANSQAAGDGATLTEGSLVEIHGKQRTCMYRVLRPLGKGSFGCVWQIKRADAQLDGQPRRDFALKEIRCVGEKAFRQALFEVELMRSLGVEGGVRTPECEDYEVRQVRRNEWRIRLVMSRLPGEPLDSWIERARASERSSPRAGRFWRDFAESSRLAYRLLGQLAPTFDQVEEKALHRDVNSHNILISSSTTIADYEEDCDDSVRDDDAENLGAAVGMDFWLIDFGLAVNAKDWRGRDMNRGDGKSSIFGDPRSTSQRAAVALDNTGTHDGLWKAFDIGGDCKYWPASSWKQFLYGWKYLQSSRDDCAQYRTRLDHFAMGITCLELLFHLCDRIEDERGETTASIKLLDDAEDQPTPELARLILDAHSAWRQYWRDATKIWQSLFSTFKGTSGKDWQQLKQQFCKENVSEVCGRNVNRLKDTLGACALAASETGAEWRYLSTLLFLLRDLISERGRVSWRDMGVLLGSKGTSSSTTNRATATRSAIEQARRGEQPVLLNADLGSTGGGGSGTVALGDGTGVANGTEGCGDARSFSATSVSSTRSSATTSYSTNSSTASARSASERRENDATTGEGPGPSSANGGSTSQHSTRSSASSARSRASQHSRQALQNALVQAYRSSLAQPVVTPGLAGPQAKVTVMPPPLQKGFASGPAVLHLGPATVKNCLTRGHSLIDCSFSPQRRVKSCADHGGLFRTASDTSRPPNGAPAAPK
ncbi:unnamed protein product [Amoebophrya sp. A25]|nr:unnamed protein product [Amoebophrya sp. A25]|eukprot:GSA25T00020300001.1